ncbi:MAG: permease-like cell division protein FtsX [Candidatus Marinimicrobia bacterium]|jgi:cell division transport system permease protein|nr:permease-like cell division protein FtsX [Candidatus Neomarinimicrobiota bacterium]
MIDQFAFLISEGFKNFFRNKLASFLCIITIFINFSILGSLFVIGFNTNSLIDFFRSKYTFEIFLENDTKSSSYESFIKELITDEIISNIKLIDKEESAKIFEEEFGENVVEMLGYNPLPVSIKVFLSEKDFEFEKVDALIFSIESIDFVDEIEYRGKYINQVEDRINLAIFIFLIFVIAIIFLSIQIISNTVKLSMSNRKDFIDILKYNGASRFFVKVPFYIESFLHSIFGGLLAFIFVKYLFTGFNSYFGVNVKLDEFLWIWIIGFSIFIGLYSSSQSMKRNLNE